MGSFYPPTTIHSEIVTTFERCAVTGLLQASQNGHQNELHAVSSYPSWPAEDLLPSYRRFQHSATAAGLRYVIYELNGKYGVLFRARTDQNNTNLRDYTAYLLARSAADQPILKEPFSADAISLASQITGLFEQRLLFDAFDLRGWNATGKELFTQKVAYYTSQKMLVDMAIPAFPCKTTNPDKAASTKPDGAEFEALVTLSSFCADVEAIYPPGCCINIVSDGHVFADCQGTDDSLVTEYTTALKIMESRAKMVVSASTREGDNATRIEGGIQFYNLDRLLRPDAQAMMLLDKVPFLQPIQHPVSTKIEESDDLCRKILVRTWGPPEEYYQDLIKSIPDHAITALYRGFSRFMFEDLAHSPEHKNATISQRKRAAEAVAFEMIQRNQSYSRLVEGVLPRHVRLSIHAHDNAGPKFAVRLIPFRPISDSAELVVTQEDAISESQQHLHIPTPWHNSLVEVHDGEEVETMLCKSKIVEDALKSGRFIGQYETDHKRGGRFVITKKQ